MGGLLAEESCADPAVIPEFGLLRTIDASLTLAIREVFVCVLETVARSCTTAN